MKKTISYTNMNDKLNPHEGKSSLINNQENEDEEKEKMIQEVLLTFYLN